MGRHAARPLTAIEVSNLTKPGRYSDGGGLYLRVAPGGSRQWLFRYMFSGKKREMSLGPVAIISLKDARIRALDLRATISKSIDPLLHREQTKSAAAIQASRSLTFDQCAAEFISSKRTGWKNEKHILQWENTIKTYVSPVLGHLPVGEIEKSLVVRVLEPIWYTKPETASRVRSRIHLILSWAIARDYRKGDNPAAWRGLLEHVFPDPKSVRPVKSFVSLPYAQAPTLIAKLREQTDMSSMSLEFLILSGKRSKEAREARWSEMDLEAAVWTIPPERMKGVKKSRNPHRVPLTARLLELLEKLRAISRDDYVFPGAKVGRPISDTSLVKLLKGRLEVDVTLHGFRSTFNVWAAERTNFPREVVGTALAHTNRDKVEAVYQRSDFLDKRRLLMNEWELFCGSFSQRQAETLSS